MKKSSVVYRIGILEIQGAFLEHRVALQKARDQLDEPVSLELIEVRKADDVTDDLDGLIIPGECIFTGTCYNKTKIVQFLGLH